MSTLPMHNIDFLHQITRLVVCFVSRSLGKDMQIVFVF